MVKSGPSATCAGRCGPHTATFHLRPAGGDFLPVLQFLAQSVGSLLQRQPPVVQHEEIVGGADGAGDVVEVGVLIGMQPDHFTERQQQPEVNMASAAGCHARPLALSQFMPQANAAPASTAIGGITKMKWRMPL